MTESPAAARVTTTIADNGVAHVRLSRPDKLNALDMPMFEALIAAGAELAALDDLRCVVFSGEGKGFCAGLDLSLFAGVGQDRPLVPRSHGRANFYQQVAIAWRDLPVDGIYADAVKLSLDEDRSGDVYVMLAPNTYYKEEDS